MYIYIYIYIYKKPESSPRPKLVGKTAFLLTCNSIFSVQIYLHFIAKVTYKIYFISAIVQTAFHNRLLLSWSRLVIVGL